MARASSQLKVDLGERSYSIRIGFDSLDEVGENIAKCCGGKQAILLTVPPVGRRYAKPVLDSLKQAGYQTRRITLPDGDATKNLNQVRKLYDALLKAGADRSSVIVALGGGMVGDLAGFVAATYLRGVAFVQIPTTLLAMVDASIGGKVGVNLPQGKNLVGAFYQPKLVWIDPATLASLPIRMRAAGFAEIAKAGAIWDARFFRRLESNVEAILALDEAPLKDAIIRACAIKAEVVKRDEREGGLRQILNFGHTLAHAVESLQRYKGALHGEAVAMGMVFAAGLSETVHGAPAGTAERVRSLLEAAELPVQLPTYSVARYREALRVDKKRKANRISFVLLQRIGKASWAELGLGDITKRLNHRG